MDNETIAPGIYPGIDHEAYLAMPGVSVSRLKLFAKAPALVRAPHQETQALRLGTVWHTAVLEPHDFERRYFRTTAERRGTQAWQGAEMQAMGRTVLKAGEYDEALRVRDAVNRHPIARELLRGANATEQSFFWIDPETGLPCRGRADLLRTDIRAVIDVKTTQSAHPEDFARAAGEYAYHWQQAFYQDGIEQAGDWRPEAFIFIAIEKAEQHLIGTYELDPASVRRGEAAIRKTLAAYAECERTGHWPGYCETITPITVPKWAG